jgi:hypothetical protein
MDNTKLSVFVNRLCKKNLKSNRVRCCEQCPFEEEIIKEYPELKRLFAEKRNCGITW